MLKEFKDFINRGNAMDLAIGVIIGAAFGAIVKSIVDDLLMPLIGIIIGGIDFKGLMVQVGSATLTYGNFIQAVINFLIIAFVIFLIVRQLNKMKKQQPATPAAPSAEEKLLTEIRDLLKRR